MDTRKLITLSSCLALTAAVCADGGSKYGNNSKTHSEKSSQSDDSDMPMFEQGTPIMSESDRCKANYKNCQVGEYPQAYNLAAGYNLREGYDFFASGSFIYWQASSDGYNESTYASTVSVNRLSAPTGPIGAVIAEGNGGTVFINPKFEPGFKIALGYGDAGAWSFATEWTRLHHVFHSSNTASSVSSAITEITSDGVVEATTTSDAFILSNFPYNYIGNELSSKWRLNMDLLDFTFGRRFYVGRKVILEPFMGIRAAWFRESLSIDLSSTPDSAWLAAAGAADNIVGFLDSKTTTSNWGLGARVGAQGQWLLGAGFRMEGKGSLSVLFTRFKKLRYSSTPVTNGEVTLPVGTSWNKNFDTVRPQAEVGLGFGWGSYFANQRLHFDIDATYDFNVFWDQQYLRTIADSVRLQTAVNPSDLFYHGPTFTARLDF